MKFRRRGFLLQNIKTKEQGQIEWIMGLFFLVILMLVMYTCLQMAAWSFTAEYLEDALAASNLASAVIDLEEYGKTRKVCLKDEQGAFEIYRETLRANLGLDEQWECKNKQIISGPVEIVAYILYNVEGQRVEIIRMNGRGEVMERREEPLGYAKAPDGTMVEGTGIYSELQFPVNGILGVSVEAHKGKLVDIAVEKEKGD